MALGGERDEPMAARNLAELLEDAMGAATRRPVGCGVRPRAATASPRPLGYRAVHEDDDLDAAERWYRIALEAGEELVPNNLAGVLRRQERWDEAETLFRRGLAEGDDVAGFNLARC